MKTRIIKSNIAKILCVSVFVSTLIILVSCSGTQTLTSSGTPIPFKVNTIIINHQGDPDSTFKAIGNHLIKNGYSFSYISDSFRSIKTNYKNAAIKGSDMATNISISATVVTENGDVKIILTGMFKQGMVLPGAPNLGESQVYHFGQSGSLVRVAWNELYRVASTYSNDLTFEIR